MPPTPTTIFNLYTRYSNRIKRVEPPSGAPSTPARVNDFGPPGNALAARARNYGPIFFLSDRSACTPVPTTDTRTRFVGRRRRRHHDRFLDLT
ncbi:hypothetical protein EVAR_24473_1 [Eumeta japonica]|uniref:Uncharacterized protein n=1 Tax=Eumeta variegata TaxID=151549 RepID=A0A4C1WYS6_EUMVA|nr:hypothetical protein EVAR_24473_1 [Eumeta japonica]